jgi:hypothetical protein
MSKNYFKKLTQIIIVFSLVAFVNSQLTAQISKKTTCFTGNVSASIRNISPDGSDNSKYIDIGAEPAFGFFVANNFSINFAIGFDFSSEKYPYLTGSYESTNNTFSFSPFFKFHFPVSEKFGFNLPIYFKYAMGTQKTKYDGSSENTRDLNTLAAGIKPGIYYFVSDHVALQANFGNLGYSVTQYTSPNTKDDQFQANFNFSSFNIGLGFYPGKE